MRKTAAILAIQCLMALPAWAQGTDEVTPYGADGKNAGIPFKAVSVTDFSREYKLEFTDGTRTYSKPIKEVRQIKLTSSADFSKAEEMAAKGDDGARVVAQYKRAEGQMSGAWQKRLIQIRRLQAAGNSGLVGIAVDDWVKLAKENSKYDPVILALAPTTVAIKGSEENKKAIDILKANAESQNANFKKLVRDLLMNVLTAEGRAEEAAVYAGGGGETTTVNPIGPTHVVSTVVGIAAINTLLAAKKYDDCIAQAKAGLRNFRDADLPDALYILAQAQLIRGKESKDQAMIGEAGLNFMRIYTFYDTYSRAGEALLNAGIACQELGNKKAAMIAFSKVLERYQNNAELAKRAQACIGSLNK
ncbi:MAG: hypothetical protein HZA50_06125 [Planctomycetes bacterium]|nr:hypothetical protein [Planctomycetota bacterium]